ncbi:MAG: alpha/beta hydrolase [Chloroflexi bacterium]|nr:alpha/beta hydrolase [Chloroflexota bacterium]
MKPESHYVHVNGLNLHYWDWGGDGPPIVFVHATSLHGRAWDPLAASLSQHFRVLALDQRGHGDSEKPPTGYHWLNLVHDLKAFIEALGLANPIGVGHSGGGAAVAHCAAVYPGTLRAAILFEPVISPPRPSPPPAGQQPSLATDARRRRMIWPSRQELYDSYHSRPPFNAWREDALWAYVNYGTRDLPDGQVEIKCPGEIEAQYYENATSLDTFNRLADIDIPVLVIRGGSDNRYAALQEMARRVAEALPKGKLITVDGAGHFVPQEKPDEVLTAIRPFLAEAAVGRAP